MDNRIVTLLMALGISPAVIAGGTNAVAITNASGTVISIKNIRLHYKTKLIVEKLKDKGALSLTEGQDGAQLVIHGDKLDNDFFEFLSGMKNVKKSDGRDLVVSDRVAAQLSKFGELNDLANSSRDDDMLAELQKKMGTKLDQVLVEGSAGSFA